MGIATLVAVLGFAGVAQAQRPAGSFAAIQPFSGAAAAQRGVSRPATSLKATARSSAAMPSTVSALALASPSLDLGAAASWLISQQVTSGVTTGALPWTPGGGVYANTQGATAEGLLRLYRLTGDQALLDAAELNAQCQMNNCISGFTYPNNGTHRFATHDPLFLIELSQFSGDPQYAQFVTDNFWTLLANGTYGDTGDNFDAAGFADYDLSKRTSQGYPELSAWDLSKLVVAAHEAGQTAAESAFMADVLASLNAADSSHNTFDVIGLTGAIWASAVSGIDLDPTTGTWASANSTADLATMLLNYQSSGGGFVGSTSLSVTDANADDQTTGYAMLALATLDRATYLSNLVSAGEFVASLQQPSGEILAYPGAPADTAGSVESHGEALEAYSDAVAGVDRWVDVGSGSDTGDCSIEASPCATIEYAISQAGPGNTINIAPGTYADETLNITTEGLQLVGESGGAKPVITRTSGGTNQPLMVIDGARNVVVSNLRFDMDQTFVAEGIIANGLVDGLSIDTNDFVDSQSVLGTSSSYGYRNAISINDSNGNSQGLGHATGSNVSITNNTISGLADPANGVFLRCGIDMDNGVGVISGNTVAVGVHDIRVRFSTVTGSSSGTTTTIDGNTLNGRGLELDSPNAGVGTITISNNQISAIAGIDDSTNYAADWSIMRLMNNSQNIPMVLSGNTFAGYEGAYRGVLIENFPGISLTGNTFTPASGASDFVSLVVSNKELNTDSPAEAPLSMSLTATGNTFNGSGVAGAGRAVEFLDDNDANGGAAFGSLVFGGSGADANNFDGNLRWYFHLDNFNCDTVTTPCPTPPLPNYAGDIGSASGTNTQVRPFPGNVSAVDNNFNGVTPAAMTGAQVNDLLARTFDNAADSQLGAVDYGLTPSQSVVYVDDGFNSSGYGDALNFTSAAAGCGNQTVYFGIDAFSSIATAITHVQSGGIVCVAKGTYSESVTLDTQPEQIIGDGNTASDTVISGPVTLSVGGTDSADPLLLQNLRISNGSGDGVRVNTASHLKFVQVAFDGNSSHGINFVASSDDVVIQNSEFTGNTEFGIRTATTAQVSNVSITGTTFSHNIAGIVLFGGSSSGNGQITDWSIDNSHFLSNDDADATPWGGGIWLKTGGAGSAIDGFSVTGSTFADNGSSNTLNQVGITVRARPGTTMQRVFICNDSFSDDPGTLGTQLTGINVFDDTGGTGYKPITVCANDTFTGLGHSISGKEQYDSRNGSEPTVNIIGGTIDNTEYINPQASVALALNGPASTVAGVQTTGYTAQLTDTGSTLTENVLVDFELSRPGGLSVGDVTLEYDTGSGYATIPLSVCGVDLCGSYGPPGTGFPVAADYNVTTSLRFTSIKSGAIAVTASVDGVDSSVSYATSSETVNVVAADAANIAANSSTSISGEAGMSASPLPSVKVTDQYGNPVPAYTVTFSPGSNSGILSGTSPATDANGVATLGGWTFGTASTETVDASGSTALSGAPVTFTATVASNFDLSDSFSSAPDYVQYGKTVDYVIVVSNAGPSTASNPVTDNLPSELDVSSATWDCFSHTAGATCGASGTGDLSDTPMIPAGGSVTYVLSATVLSAPVDETISDQTSVGTTGDGNTSNNTATANTQIVLFRNGFEAGGNGATAAVAASQPAAAGTLDNASTYVLDPASAPQTPNRPVTWLEANDASGRSVFHVDSLRTAGNLLVRIVSDDGNGREVHTRWIVLGAQPGGLALAATSTGSHAVVLLGADNASLQANVPDWVILPLTIYSVQ